MRRIVSAVLAVLTAFVLCVPAVAATPQKITSLHPQFKQQLTTITLDGEALAVSELEDVSAYASSTLEIVLLGKDKTDLFYDQNGEPVHTADVTVSKMRAARAAVEVDATTGKELIASAVLDVRDGGGSASKPVLRLKLVGNLKSTEALPFDISIVFSIGGVRQPQSALRIAGTVSNREIDVTAKDTAIAPAGAVMAASEAVPSVTVDVGSNVSLSASLKANGRYWAIASFSTDYADVALLSKYPQLTDVLVLETAGFSGSEIKNVTIASAEVLYVYDEDGKSLGVTNRPLPVSEKYYLAKKKLDFTP